MIKLLPIAVVDLSLNYAHNSGNGTIKHYKVPFARTLVHTEESPAKMVQEYVEKTTGEEVEIAAALNEGITGLVVTEVPEVLNDLSDAKKQLEQAKIKSMLYQYIDIPYDLGHLWNFIAVPINKVLNKMNKLWAKYKQGVDFYSEEGIFLFGMELFPRLIKTLPVKDKMRRVSPCTFLAVNFEESDRNKAIELIKEDIKILADNNLILGHLCMPSQILLADTIGSGQKQMAIFCYLFLDHKKFGQLVGVENPLIRTEYLRLKGKNDRLELNYFLDLKTQCEEGSVGNTELNPYNKYKIETIEVFANEAQERHEAYLKSCEEQRDMLDKINKRNYENEKKWKAANEVQTQKLKENPLPSDSDDDSLGSGFGAFEND